MPGAVNEPSIMRVDRDGRVIIPQSICEAVGWISGERPLVAWLLALSFGRKRLLRPTDVEEDPTLRALAAKLSSSSEPPPASPVEFDDEADVMLSARLIETRISLSEGRWRITLPRVTISTWGLRPQQNEVAVLISRGYVEIWAMERVKSALSAPLTDIV